MIPAGDNVTQYLIDWKGGDGAARDLLLPVVYQELRRLARSYMKGERSAFTLQPTALVHETYLRLAAQKLPDWESRSHFFGVAAHLMRQILVDHARHNKRQKRGGGEVAASIEEAMVRSPERSSDLLNLDDALAALEKLDPRKCQVIEMRYFAGFTIEETAEAIAISPATVAKEQRLAEAWLQRELNWKSAP